MSQMRRDSKAVQRPVKVLICGGSYAGLAAATTLNALCDGKLIESGFPSAVTGQRIPAEITVVDERDGFYHLIGSPLALADDKYAPNAWHRFADIPALQHSNLQFLHGSIEALNNEEKVAHIKAHNGPSQDLSYDYFIAATGLRRVWPTVPQTLTKKKYLLETQGHIDQVRSAEQGVVVIGGGAVGIEMAAELKMVAPEVKVTLIHSRDRLLSAEPLPGDFQDKALELLLETGVECVMSKRVLDVESSPEPAKARQTLKLSDGSEMHASHVINAVSKPTSTAAYLPKCVLTDEGHVSVRDTLHFNSTIPNARSHFAIGDIMEWKAIKRCGGALYGGKIVAHNIYQELLLEMGLIDEPEYFSFPKPTPAIAVALGKNAVGWSEATGDIKSGPELAKIYFEDDLGLNICWRSMGLGDQVPVK